MPIANKKIDWSILLPSMLIVVGITQIAAPIYLLQWMINGHGLKTINGQLHMQHFYGIYVSAYLLTATTLSLAASALFRTCCITHKFITPSWLCLIWLLLCAVTLPIREAAAPMLKFEGNIAEKQISLLLGIQIIFMLYVLKTPWDILRDRFTAFLDRQVAKTNNRTTRETRDNHA